MPPTLRKEGLPYVCSNSLCEVINFNDDAVPVVPDAVPVPLGCVLSLPVA